MEEIEELRAKAIASMPFSTNPNSSSTAAAISGGGGCGGGELKSLKSREEGEVSSGEDAVEIFLLKLYSLILPFPASDSFTAGLSYWILVVL
ncbi:hypothetical protein MA16_Dca026462 [Dendrobium catenatum]|uniref:Uncharacterized protein n=1 Tax=Dendrobium catenatum TaxID=906689 RepID=A0A2I0VY61_9ASPA|nr:hypothetical protein MA16_Dca026462 [Dendrobium catenatum]